MRERFEAGVDATLGAQIERASVEYGRVVLRLRMHDGAHTELTTDHVVAATGYWPDIDRLDFLSEPLRGSLRTHTDMPSCLGASKRRSPGCIWSGHQR